MTEHFFPIKTHQALHARKGDALTVDSCAPRKIIAEMATKPQRTVENPIIKIEQRKIRSRAPKQERSKIFTVVRKQH